MVYWQRATKLESNTRMSGKYRKLCAAYGLHLGTWELLVTSQLKDIPGFRKQCRRNRFAGYVILILVLGSTVVTIR